MERLMDVSSTLTISTTYNIKTIRKYNLIVFLFPKVMQMSSCDEIINNNGDIEFLKMQLRNTWKRLTNMDLRI